MALYLSSAGEKIEVASMDKKYLVNALIYNVIKVAGGGRNANPDDVKNIKILKTEIINRLRKIT